VWMSYAELGRLRGISAASAKRLSNRRRWVKRSGNDGTTRVAVPAAEAVSRETASGDVSGDMSLAIKPLEAAVAALREQLEHANQRADEAHRRADAADTDRGAAVALADQSVTLLTEAVARADRAEQARDAECGLADALRERILEMQSRVARVAEVEAERDLLRGEAEAAQIAQAAVEADATELRDQLNQTRAQAEAALQEAVVLKAAADAAGRGGRWARLRRAWRGE
jgi:chromosome segregation ATPase